MGTTGVWIDDDWTDGSLNTSTLQGRILNRIVASFDIACVSHIPQTNSIVFYSCPSIKFTKCFSACINLSHSLIGSKNIFIDTKIRHGVGGLTS